MLISWCKDYLKRLSIKYTNATESASHKSRFYSLYLYMTIVSIVLWFGITVIFIIPISVWLNHRGYSYFMLWLLFTCVYGLLHWIITFKMIYMIKCDKRDNFIKSFVYREALEEEEKMDV